MSSARRRFGQPLTRRVSTSATQASGFTLCNLQVSISEASTAQFSAPRSWPAKSAFLRLSAMGLIERSTVFGTLAADLRLDLVQRRDPLQGLAGDRRRSLVRDLEEPPSAMRPAMCKDHPFARPAFGVGGLGHGFVGDVGVGLQDAAEIL